MFIPTYLSFQIVWKFCYPDVMIMVTNIKIKTIFTLANTQNIRLAKPSSQGLRELRTLGGKYRPFSTLTDNPIVAKCSFFY